MLRFTSLLDQSYSGKLEALMFFNPGQQDMLAAIMDSVEQFGSPSVVVDKGHLRIKVDKLDHVQTIFALEDDSLVGILLYTRFSTETLTVIHIVVDVDYSSSGKFSKSMLMMRMLELLRKSARSISGVKKIHIFYGNNRTLDCSV